MRPKSRPSLPTIVAAVLAVVAYVGTALWSTERIRVPLSAVDPIGQLTRLEPMSALPRTELVLATVEARRFLDAGRPWAAWMVLEEHVREPDVAGASAVLLAARASGEWGNWRATRTLLADRPWLDRADGGEGLFLLARAEEELGDLTAATAAYRRYASLSTARARGMANARLGRILRETGDLRGAAAAFAAAAPEAGEMEDWMRALQAELLAKAEDPDAAALAAAIVGGSAPVRLRRVQAEVGAWTAAGEFDQAKRRLDWEARVLNSQGARHEAAQLQLDHATLLTRAGRRDEARELLRSIAWEPTMPAEFRREAAQRLGDLPNRVAADELARAAGYEAGGRPGLAARSIRAALELGAPDEATTRLRLARLLWEARDFGPARGAYQRVAGMMTDRDAVADAELHAARALFRSAGSNARGRQQRETALAELRSIVDRFPGSPAAGSALFLLGDANTNIQAAISLYRRAAAVESSPDAQEALFRVGDRSLRQNDTAGAIRAWEEYVGRFPRGEQTARVAYQVGKLHEAAGRQSPARAMYTAALLADPVSYHAIRAGNRLGTDPLERILAEPRPWVGLAADPADAAAVLRRLDLLESAGLREEWQAEFAAAQRAFRDRPAAMITLAEGVRDRNYPVEAIRLGRQLVATRDGDWDERLLRVVFPFPYRRLIEEESRRYAIDPLLFAALIRQESSFQPTVRSWVGATGLGQIMPATGRWLAPSIGVHSYSDRLLDVPEVNLRMGAKYLGDLLRRYDGSRDLALAGYNAGPARADRWRRELNYGRDTDAFREAIPFDETRHYVMIVNRNYAIYQRLYGNPRGPGLVDPTQ